MSGGRVVPDVLAAVDLGSNSFHMVVARYSHGQLVILDRLREMVRLAAGMGDSGRLDDAATERALRSWEAETGESAAALELFRRISESGEFTASAAHEAFAGIKRKR